MPSEQLIRNKEALARLAKKAGVRPSRSTGQNFLIDGDVADALVDAARLTSGEHVLEIGPGFGAVTQVLLERGAQVTAVELDRTLAATLPGRFSRELPLTVVCGDILKIHLDPIVKDGAYLLVSSLPFNITSIVLRRFLEDGPRPTAITLIIQEEVAQRIVAAPGEMSVLSVAVQYLGTPSYIRSVPRTSFWPEPDVDAAIVYIPVRPLPDNVGRKNFFRLVKIGFSARRKMLHNNLTNGFHVPPEKIKEILRKTGLSETVRAQELSVDQWLKLAEKMF